MRFKIIGGFLELEPSKGALSEISSKLKKIADAEKPSRFVDTQVDLSVRDIESLKRKGNASEIVK